ncbi:60S ribosomal protein L25 [Entophlyctis luteolus]|nr:60S ribosomal protein L25 [Entophlyctis luteolus]
MALQISAIFLEVGLKHASISLSTDLNEVFAAFEVTRNDSKNDLCRFLNVQDHAELSFCCEGPCNDSDVDLSRLGSMQINNFTYFHFLLTKTSDFPTVDLYGYDCQGGNVVVPTAKLVQWAKTSDSKVMVEVYGRISVANGIYCASADRSDAVIEKISSILETPTAFAELSPLVGYHQSFMISLPEPLTVAIALIAHLPINQHAFADPFQISGLNSVNNNVQYIPYGSPDLECAASNNDGALTNGVFIVVNSTAIQQVETPFHLRYQPPNQNGGTVVVPVLPISAYLIRNRPSINETSRSSSNFGLNSLLFSLVGLESSFGVEIVQIAVNQSNFSINVPTGSSLDERWVGVTLAACVAAMAPATKTATPAVKKAASAKKAALKGTGGKLTRKVRTSTTFRLPKTLKLARNPKYPRRSVPRVSALDAHAVVKFPLNTESAMKKIEDHNTLVFVCDVRSNKRQIKDAIKKLYDIDAVKINTLVRPDGKKKAYVKLDADVEALEVANRIGFV